ncbi:MAG: radical SAM protein [Elusimicrobia bacterium]|nr:radical SAM protein [Elusimicrobiota bacterium]
MKRTTANADTKRPRAARSRTESERHLRHQEKCGRQAARTLAGEPTDLSGLLRRLKMLGLKAQDPLHSAGIGEVYLMLTMGCNLRCRACSLWGTGGACRDAAFLKAFSRPAPLGRFLTLIDELVEFKPEYLNLSGGEPLMTRRWAPLAERARDRGLRAILTTNGVLLERCVERVADLFDQVSISIACPPQLRERLGMGAAGHYQAMMRGLKSLARLRDRHPRRKPVLRLMCEVFDANGEHLVELIDDLDEQGVVFDETLFMHLIFNGPRALAAQKKVLASEFGLPFLLWKGYGYRPCAMDFEAMARVLETLRERCPRARFSADLRSAEDLRDYYRGRREAIGRAFCDGPWRQVNLFPNGDVWACPDFVLGNITEQGFADIWEGPKARALRRRIYRRLFPTCRGCFSFYEKEQPMGAG